VFEFVLGMSGRDDRGRFFISDMGSGNGLIWLVRGGGQLADNDRFCLDDYEPLRGRTMTII
jgi:hypothetical protein